eukprot:TRINITY_DN3579_c0_g1_i1.p1 TRINITY_DN3579_c0_g1~~TRINITY_DN3579_c0_g1_i1.p1  ORF type:complete len:982 (-),score=188.56 TRINITY_DN3579_c0_g1_i1:53-2917(-)
MDPSSEVQKPSEALLEQYKSIPGFCPALLKLASTKEIIADHRLCCLILLKNTVQEKWKRSTMCREPIGDQDKRFVRETVFTLVDEDLSHSNASQLALLIGRIARMDFPNDWPELLSKLFNVTCNLSLAAKPKGLLCLHHVLDSLRSRCLPNAKRQLRETTPEIFLFVNRLWKESMGKILECLKNFERYRDVLANEFAIFSSIAHLCNKILYGLLLQGFDEWTESNGILAFLRDMLELWKTLIVIRHGLPSGEVKEFLFRCERNFGKIMVLTHERHPLQWAPLLPQFLEFCFSAIQNMDVHEENEKFLVHCMTFMKQVFVGDDYVPGTQAHEIVSAFGTPQNIVELVKLLIRKYVTLTLVHLEEWNDDPESFLTGEEMDLYTEKRRSMAENLILALLDLPKYKPALVECFKGLLEETKQAVSLQDVLNKDAVYNVVGIGSSEIYEHIDFPAWLSNTLIPELRNADPNFKIIQRRILCLLYQWITSVPVSLRPDVYGVLVAFLDNHDMAIRLTAALSLDIYIGDMEFNADDFSPFLNATIDKLFKLVPLVETGESKLKLLTAMNNLIGQVGERIKPHAPQFLQLASALWNQTLSSQHTGFMKTAVLQNLQVLVTAVGENYEFQQFLVPVIQYSIQTKTDDSQYLLEDGIELWLTTLSHTHRLSDGLSQLFPGVFEILSRDYEYVAKCMRILEAYILMGGIEFLQAHFINIVKLLEQVVGDVRDDGTIATMSVIEKLVMLLPSEVITHVEPLLAKILSLFLSDKESPRSKVHYTSSFCRLLLHHRDYFFLFFDRMSASQQNASRCDILHVCVPLFLEKVDSMSEPRRRKATVMSLLGLITVPQLIGNPTLFDFFRSLVIHAIGAVVDEEAGDGPKFDVMPTLTILEDDALYGNAFATNVTPIREWNMLYANDVVNKISTRDFLTQQLKQLETLNHQLFELLMSNIPTPVLDQFNKRQ